MEKERLDIFLVQTGNAKSREQAKSLICGGGVKVNGVTVKKPSFKVDGEDSLEVTVLCKYVGRGGLKLEKALSVFDLSVSEKICLDVGASTGGFTDCMLQNGASFVYSLDVGHGQLDPSLVCDSRVKNLEGVHVKDLSSEMLDGNLPQFVSIDVSFISLEKVLLPLLPFISDGCDVVCLFKPQFEVGKTNKGIVRNEKEHIRALRSFVSFLCDTDLSVRGLDFSPIKGGDGNTEFLFYLKRGGENAHFDISKTVKAAHSRQVI